MHQIKALISTLLLSLTVLSYASESPREVTWEDLLPPTMAELRERAFAVNVELTGLPEQKREAYEAVQDERDLRSRVERGFLTQENMGDEYRAMLADPPSKKHPDAVAFWQKVDELEAQMREERKKPNQTLNGTAIRMPGYVLPLEFDGEMVKEFLLVPFVGACIHTPPPPSNQMLFVKAGKSFKSEGLFEPVWVEGVITSEFGKHQLSLVDGSSDVEASYSMQAVKIEPYKAN